MVLLLFAFAPTILNEIGYRVWHGSFAEKLAENPLTQIYLESDTIEPILSVRDIKPWYVVASYQPRQAVQATYIASYIRKGDTETLVVLWATEEEVVRFLIATDSEEKDESITELAREIKESQPHLSQYREILRRNQFEPPYTTSFRLFNHEKWLQTGRLEVGTAVSPVEPPLLYWGEDIHSISFFQFYWETDRSGRIIQRGMYNISEEGPYL